MAMRDAILNFAKQFAYEPVIENEERLGTHKKFIVLGMGGSHLAADLLEAWNLYGDVIVHADYGLPAVNESDMKEYLIIASSASGNTEEVIDGFELALERGYSVAVLSMGGKLIELAKQKGTPYIQMPDAGIQPRMALGFSLRALFKLMRAETASRELAGLAETLKPEKYEAEGQAIARRLMGRVPVIYASRANWPIAYNWKIKFNETGKIPAFYNVLPELNHNEMTGFDVREATKNLSDKFYFLILKDAADDERILKRVHVLETLYRARGLPVEVIELHGETKIDKAFSSLIFADWATYYIATQYGLEPEQVPMAEEFKKLIKNSAK